MGYAVLIPIHAPVDIYVLYLHWFDFVVCFWMYLFILACRIWVRICILSQYFNELLVQYPLSNLRIDATAQGYTSPNGCKWPAIHNRKHNVIQTH